MKYILILLLLFVGCTYSGPSDPHTLVKEKEHDRMLRKEASEQLLP